MYVFEVSPLFVRRDQLVRTKNGASLSAAGEGNFFMKRPTIDPASTGRVISRSRATMDMRFFLARPSASQSFNM